MALVKLDLNPGRRTLRQFGIIALVFFGAVGAWTLYRSTFLGFELEPPATTILGGTLVALGALSGLLALVAPAAVRPLYVGLVVITFPIGFVVSHVILAVLYYLVLTPIGLLMRLFGYDPMQRRLDPAAPSYWEDKAPVTDVKSYFRQY